MAGRHGGDRGNQYTGGKVLNSAPCQEPQGKSRDIAAKAVGMKPDSYRKAKAVVQSGDLKRKEVKTNETNTPNHTWSKGMADHVGTPGECRCVCC